MNWFILELPLEKNSDIKINENLKIKIKEIEYIIHHLKNLLTPH